MKVKDAMSRHVWACKADDSLEGATRLMWDHDVGCIPVVDDEGQLCGVVTDRDVAMAAYTQGKPLVEIPVSSAMASQPITVFPGDPLFEAERLMRTRQIRRLPVVDELGCLAGMITLNDVARLHAHPATSRDVVGAEEVALTLAAIGRPRMVTLAR